MSGHPLGGLLFVWLLAAGRAAPTVTRPSTASRRAYGGAIWGGAGLLSLRPERLGPRGRARFPPGPGVAWTGVALNRRGVVFAGGARIHWGRLRSGASAVQTGHVVIRSGAVRWSATPSTLASSVPPIGTALPRDSLAGLLGLGPLTAGSVMKLRPEERFRSSTWGQLTERLRPSLRR